MSSNWNLWQLIDSFFPTGGFAHSYGLEAAIQSGIVTDLQALEVFLTSTLENCGSLVLPFVFASHRQQPNVDAWIQVDKILNATLTNHVARRASISQGSALLRTAAAVYPQIPQLKSMRECCRGNDNVSAHHAGVFGAVCGLLGLDLMSSQRAYLFITLRDILSAATRLNLVGPLQAAALQGKISSTVAEVVLEKYANRDVGDAHQITPLLDAVQGRHDLLFSRLFCS